MQLPRNKIHETHMALTIKELERNKRSSSHKNF